MVTRVRFERTTPSFGGWSGEPLTTCANWRNSAPLFGPLGFKGTRMDLPIARNLDLPIDAVTQTFGMIDRKRFRDTVAHHSEEGLLELSRLRPAAMLGRPRYRHQPAAAGTWAMQSSTTRCPHWRGMYLPGIRRLFRPVGQNLLGMTRSLRQLTGNGLRRTQDTPEPPAIPRRFTPLLPNRPAEPGRTELRGRRVRSQTGPLPPFAVADPVDAIWLDSPVHRIVVAGLRIPLPFGRQLSTGIRHSRYHLL
jgi:hypothetical protein